MINLNCCGNILRKQPKDTPWAGPMVVRCQNNKYFGMEIAHISKTKYKLSASKTQLTALRSDQ